MYDDENRSNSKLLYVYFSLYDTCTQNITQRRYRSALIDSSLPLYNIIIYVSQDCCCLRMSYAKIVARGTVDPAYIFFARTMPPKIFALFTEGNICYFILYLYCLFFCHLFSQKEITIFIHFRIIIICVSPKNSRLGGQVLLLAIVRHKCYVRAQLVAQDRYSYIGRYYGYVYTPNFIYNHYIYVYYIMYCVLLPGSGHRPTRIRIYIASGGCGGVGERHRLIRKIRWNLCAPVTLPSAASQAATGGTPCPPI